VREQSGLVGAEDCALGACVVDLRHLEGPNSFGLLGTEDLELADCQADGLAEAPLAEARVLALDEEFRAGATKSTSSARDTSWAPR
jgi:hypothetical protein